MSCTPEHMIREQQTQLAQHRHVPARDLDGIRWQQRDLLTRKMRARLACFEEAAVMAIGQADDKSDAEPDSLELLVGISQNIGFGDVGSSVPTLARGRQDLEPLAREGDATSVVWHVERTRSE